MAQAYALAGSMAMNAISNVADNQNSARMAEDYARLQAALNWKYAKKSALNIPTYNRRGIEKAGYNPMLALNGLLNAESSWTNSGGPTHNPMGNIGSNAFDMKLSRESQDNENAITGAQVDKYNAETTLTEMKTQTEIFNQIESDARTMLANSQRTLNNLHADNFEREQAREDKKVATMELDSVRRYKVGMAQAQASTLGSQAAMSSAKTQANALEISKPGIEAENISKKWKADHPVMSSLLPTIPGAAAGIGGALLLRSPVGAAAGVIQGVSSGHPDYGNYRYLKESDSKIYRSYR